MAKKKNKPKDKPKAKKVEQTLHIMQASLRVFDPLDQRRADIEYALSQDADVVCFTESGEAETRGVIQAQALMHGYAHVLFTPGDSQLAVKLKGPPDARLKAKGGVMVSAAIPGSFGPRYVRWARFAWYDQDIWMHAAHWVFIPHVESSHGELTALHTKTTNTMCAQVKKHGQGDSISFFAGDINVDEGADNALDHPNMPNYIFRANGLLTIWDELHVNPPITVEHSTFDIIGCYRPDKQVAGTRYIVHPKQNSDHRFVSAFYTVDVSKKVVTGGGGGDGGDGDGGGTGADPTTDDDPGVSDPDFYATGGNIDWSDYLDNELYPLPHASGDSQYGG